MAIEVYNPNAVVEPYLTKKDLEPGVLYKALDDENNLEPYDTVYTVTLNGDVIWFENPQESVTGRLNIVDASRYRFTKAPAGTSFTPSSSDYGYVVNLTNGIGCFSKTNRCHRATREEAFKAALEWD